jgi:hypothetical protein
LSVRQKIKGNIFMEITNNAPINEADFNKSQAAKYAGNVPEEEKLEKSRQIDGLREEILSGE